MKTISINTKQKLFVIKSEGVVSCLGFDVCERQSIDLARELDYTRETKRKGTKKAYKEYLKITDLARKENQKTGRIFQSNLIPEFIGLENKRVEVVFTYGITARFYIGKSTGFTPCHLVIKTSRSSGGDAISKGSIKSFKLV